MGVAGIFLPLLPTTPLLLLAAALYCKGSPKLYKWLLNNKYLGSYIRNYREEKAITLQTKVVSLTLLWVTLPYSIFFVVHILWLRILLGAVLIAVTIHILSFKTLKKNRISDN